MLKDDVEAYIGVRRAAGFKFEGAAWMLRSYARYATSRGEEFITTDSAIAWAAFAPTAKRRAKKLETVRLFARFLRPEDPRHELPPDAVFCSVQLRPPPYVFTDEEIGLLVGAAVRLGPTGSIRPLTFATLFGLLAVTGMRVSEALSLLVSDVTPDGLLVRETKFRKSRLLPLHSTTTVALEKYVFRRRRHAGTDEHLFVSSSRPRLKYGAVRETFLKTCQAAGLPKQQQITRRLRLHDLRHTFAVRVLEACPDTRDAATQRMLALTTYMGHARISSTYWYLENTPRLLEDIAGASEVFADGEAP